MRLTLIRDVVDDPDCTEGMLSIDGIFFCYTLELPVKDGLPGSAIPPGVYRIELKPSPKFMGSDDPWVDQYAETIPHLLDLPATRSNILIHWGNNPHDTEGCILVGKIRGEDFVNNSRVAFEQLHDHLLQADIKGEEITLEVQGGIPALATDREA